MSTDKNEEIILDLKPLPSTTSASISANPHIPSVSASAVLGESESLPEGTPICRGFDFNETLKTSEENDKTNHQRTCKS